jgi:hypothetical protein
MRKHITGQLSSSYWTSPGHSPVMAHATSNASDDVPLDNRQVS